MNASPFKSFQEFTDATGAFYSFSGQPIVATICLILALGIVVWFIVAAYKIKH